MASVVSTAEVNRQFYDALWRDARLQRPERFNTWPLVSRLCAGRRSLELGAGARPRLPLETSTFVDASRPAVEGLRAAGARAVAGDARELPFADASFEVVAAFDIIEHVADDARVIAEIARVLAPGGSLLFSVPLHPEAWTAFDDTVGHERRYRPAEIRGALAARGLHLTESAIFGMQPKSTRLVAFGMWMLNRNRRRAMLWYNNVFMPIALHLQKPLAFSPGLVDTPGVDEIVAVAERRAGSHADCQ